MMIKQDKSMKKSIRSKTKPNVASKDHKFKKSNNYSKKLTKTAKFKQQDLDGDEDLNEPSDADSNFSDNEGTEFSTKNNNEDIQKWYEETPWNYSADDILEGSIVDQLRREANHIFEEEVTTHSGKPPATMAKTDFNWIKTVIARGTLGDKIAAYVLLIQDNPVVNIGFLRNMVSMIKVGKKRECFMTMDTLVDLFMESLLPPDKKLRYFAQQPHKLAQDEYGPKRRRLLMLWYLEDQLKAIYSTFLQALNSAAHDSVDANKEKVIQAMYKLLKSHPEQEATLLTQIINKLGDPSQKIGSKAIYTLTQLLDEHPAMQGVVIDELERFIFRPNMSRRAQYYAICFLSQFSYDSNSSKLASKAITIYFALFKACIKTGEIDSRMMGALLTGVSRAYPFSEKDSVSLTEHINTVYKVVHLSNANVAIHALCLLNQVVGDNLTDRFMTTLYRKVGEPKMFSAAHHALFLSLIFRVLKRDTEYTRVAAFIKRLLQISMFLSVPNICGLLVVVSQIIHGKKGFKIELETKASSLVTIPDDDDGEETYKDAEEIILNPETSEPATVLKAEGGEEVKTNMSWNHSAMKPHKSPTGMDVYDPYQRNPLYAAADKATFPELNTLSKHFHPTVSLFASNILEGKKIVYSGDPLQDFTLIRFLEKFVFKNPKQPNVAGSQLSTFSLFSRKKFYSMVGVRKLRANTNDYLNADEKAVPVDEKFMYKYLKEKAAEPASKKITKVKKKEENDESETESLDDEEFDALMRGVGGLPKDDEEVDFIREIGEIPASKSLKRGHDEEDELDEDGEEDNEDEIDDKDGDNEFGDQELEEFSDDGSMAEDFDGDEMADDWGEGDEMKSDDEDDSPFLDELPKAKNKKSSQKKKSNTGGLFAAAEEFAELLEDDNYQAGSSSALSNKDNAALKQLKWEGSRDRWIKGNNFKKSKGSERRKGFKQNGQQSARGSKKKSSSVSRPGKKRKF